MKKVVALFLSVLMLLSLAACTAGENTREEPQFTVPLDDDSYVFQANPEAAPLPGGSVIALAAESSSLESGAEALLWKGIQTFASNFGYTAQSFTYGDGETNTAEDALRNAAQSGATLVVCRGEEMAKALFQIQANFPACITCCLTESHTMRITRYTPRSPTCIVFSSRRSRPAIWPVMRQ